MGEFIVPHCCLPRRLWTQPIVPLPFPTCKSDSLPTMVALSVTAETQAGLTVMLWSVDSEVVAIKASVL